MELTITRVNKAEEIAEIARLASKIWREYYSSIISVEQIEYMLDNIQSVPAITDQINNQGYEYYLMQIGDSSSSIVGYMSVKAEEEKLFLSKLYIDKQYRGQGYASRAITYLEKLCNDRNLNVIWLTVNRQNESSIAIYKKKGFQIVREQVADIGKGFVMDDFIMEKEIKS